MRTLSYIMSSSDSESQSSIVILAIRIFRDALVNNLEEECCNTVDAVSKNWQSLWAEKYDSFSVLPCVRIGTIIPSRGHLESFLLLWYYYFLLFWIVKPNYHLPVLPKELIWGYWRRSARKVRSSSNLLSGMLWIQVILAYISINMIIVPLTFACSSWIPTI